MTALAKIEPFQGGITADKINLLKNTVCKGATNDEFELFLHVCKRTGLDPFAKQIYAVKRGNSMTIQTGIDGYRLIAERTGKYSPGREPTFNYDSNGKLMSATSYIKKQTSDGSWHEVAATAFYSEYVQEFNGKPTKFWDKMGHTMTAKCAEALALRKAFPDVFSGVYTQEEMQQAEVPDTATLKASMLEKIDDQDQELFEEYIYAIKQATKKTVDQVIVKMSSENDIKNRFLSWKEKHLKELQDNNPPI